MNRPLILTLLRQLLCLGDALVFYYLVMQLKLQFLLNQHVLFDPDNVSDGKAAFECAPDAPHEWSKGEFLCPPVAAGTPPFTVPHPPAANVDICRAAAS